VTELRVAAVTVKVALFVIVPYVAEIATEVLAETGALAIEKVAVVTPEATVTLAGTVATGVLLLLSVTRAPPAGAGPLSVTVPVDELPPRTDVGLNVTELSVTGAAVMLNEPVVVLFAKDAEMLTEVPLVTGEVVTVNVAVLAFAGTVTLTGTAASELLLLLSETKAPDGGAEPFRVTVPVDELAPTTEFGLRVSEVTWGGVTVSPVVRVLLL